MVAARRVDVAAVLAQATPKRRSGPLGQRMGADVNDARADPAAGTALAAFEQEENPAVGP